MPLPKSLNGSTPTRTIDSIFELLHFVISFPLISSIPLYYHCFYFNATIPCVVSTPLTTSRILATLDWPIVLAFETKATPADPNSVIDEAIKKRTKLLHLIYPPTLTTLPPARVVVAEWTPDILTDTGMIDLPPPPLSLSCC